MEKSCISTTVATVAELKANLRLSGTAFDADLQLKLDSAVQMAGDCIGRDLTLSEVYSFPFDFKTKISVPNAFNVSSVEINGASIPASEWQYDGTTLRIFSIHTGTDVITVKTAYNPAIRTAVILIASELFTNPVDSVKQLPTSSERILMSYRRYASKRG